ncbi:MAG: hypothetical protein AAF583_09045 [Pseudomonadota bacterium]
MAFPVMPLLASRRLAPVLLLALLAQPAAALTVAFDVPAGTMGNQAFGGVLAMDFDVLSPITVRELGAFDSNSDGIAGAVTVELWRRSGSTGLERLVALGFPGNGGFLRGGHRFRAIDPLPLTLGQYSIVAYGFSEDDPNGNADGFGSFPGDFPWTLDNGAGALLFTGSRFGGPAGGSIGTIPDSTIPPNKYAAGTFAFDRGLPDEPTPIPLPPTIVTLLAGLWALRTLHARR